MTDVVLPHTFTDGPGNVASGAQVMDNLNALVGGLNASARLLAAVPLTPFSVGANGAVTFGTASVTHANRPGWAVLISWAENTGGVTAGGGQIAVRRDAVTLVAAGAAFTAGAHGTVCGAAQYSASSGSHSWTAVASLGNVPTTLQNPGSSLLLLFEQ